MLGFCHKQRAKQPHAVGMGKQHAELKLASLKGQRNAQEMFASNVNFERFPAQASPVG